MAIKHLEKTKNRDLLIYDRNYGATWFMCKHILEEKDFLIRMKKNSINNVRDFFNSNEKDKIIEIKKISYDSERRFNDRKIKFKPFKIRLIKVILDTGEVEVLVTSLLD